ncbi:hypothetical protein ACOSQ2_001127 [Xanthoceras sorbifolium]
MVILELLSSFILRLCFMEKRGQEFFLFIARDNYFFACARDHATSGINPDSLGFGTDILDAKVFYERECDLYLRDGKDHLHRR